MVEIYSYFYYFIHNSYFVVWKQHFLLLHTHFWNSLPFRNFASLPHLLSARLQPYWWSCRYLRNEFFRSRRQNAVLPLKVHRSFIELVCVKKSVSVSWLHTHFSYINNLWNTVRWWFLPTKHHIFVCHPTCLMMAFISSDVPRGFPINRSNTRVYLVPKVIWD